jgi:hypothetical protein
MDAIFSLEFCFDCHTAQARPKPKSQAWESPDLHEQPVCQIVLFACIFKIPFNARAYEASLLDIRGGS